MKREEEMDGEELWVRFLIRFILIATMLWIVIKLSILMTEFYSPY
jgi:hypothetical protein